MAECYNDILIITRDNRCIFRSGGEFQKFASIVECQCSGEQCECNALKSERSICPTWLNKSPKLSLQSRPLLPIEPIVKPKTSISFINDIVRRKCRLYTDNTPRSLQSHAVRRFNFTCENDKGEFMEKEKTIKDPYITQCFAQN